MNLGDNGIGVTIFVTGIWITHVCLRTGPDEAHLSDDCLSGHFLFFRVFPYFYRALSLRIFLHAFRLRISEFCSVKLLLVVCWLSEILTVCVYERPACFGGNWPTPIAASFKIAHCFFSRSEILPVGFVWIKKLHGFVLFYESCFVTIMIIASVFWVKVNIVVSTVWFFLIVVPSNFRAILLF